MDVRAIARSLVCGDRCRWFGVAALSGGVLWGGTAGLAFAALGVLGCDPVELDFKTLRSALHCSVVDQDCDADTKCTLILDDEKGQARCLDESQLVPPIPEGSTCKLMPSASDSSASDYCAKGSLCSELGPEPLASSAMNGVPKSDTGAVRRCRRFCDDDSDCSRGRHCYALQELAGVAGLCIDTCDVGDDACPYGFECALVRTVTNGLIGACMPPGRREHGQICDAANRCERGFVCGGGATTAGTCQALCEPHVADAGWTNGSFDNGCQEGFFCDPFRTLTGQGLAYCRARLD